MQPRSLLLLLGLNLFSPLTAAKAEKQLCVCTDTSRRSHVHRQRETSSLHIAQQRTSSVSSARAAEDEWLTWPASRVLFVVSDDRLLPFISASLFTLRPYSASSSLFRFTFHYTRRCLVHSRTFPTVFSFFCFDPIYCFVVVSSRSVSFLKKKKTPSSNAEFDNCADSPRHAKIIKQLLNGTEKDAAAQYYLSAMTQKLFSIHSNQSLLSKQEL